MEIFKGIVGQIKALHFLNLMVQRDSIRQSLLFEGPPGVGKSLIADQFASYIAAPEDIHRYEPEGKSSQHTIESLRELSEQVHLKAFGRKCSVFILNQAHQMLPAAANALLKTFEEPLKGVVIILLTSNANELLPTIRSRSVRIPFSRLENEQIRDLVRAKGELIPNDPMGNCILEFGRVGFALRSSKNCASKRLEIFEQLLKGPIVYSTLHSTLRDLEKAMNQYLEDYPRAFFSAKKWQDVAATTKEQLQKGAQAQAQSNLKEELEFFFELLIKQVNKNSIEMEEKARLQFPTRFLAKDLQRLQLLWQRGGRISQLMESLFLRWPLLTY